MWGFDLSWLTGRKAPLTGKEAADKDLVKRGWNPSTTLPHPQPPPPPPPPPKPSAAYTYWPTLPDQYVVFPLLFQEDISTYLFKVLPRLKGRLIFEYNRTCGCQVELDTPYLWDRVEKYYSPFKLTYSSGLTDSGGILFTDLTIRKIKFDPDLCSALYYLMLREKYGRDVLTNAHRHFKPNRALEHIHKGFRVAECGSSNLDDIINYFFNYGPHDEKETIVIYKTDTNKLADAIYRIFGNHVTQRVLPDPPCSMNNTYETPFRKYTSSDQYKMTVASGVNDEFLNLSFVMPYSPYGSWRLVRVENPHTGATANNICALQNLFDAALDVPNRKGNIRANQTYREQAIDSLFAYGVLRRHPT